MDNIELMRPKDIPANVWQKCLTEDDWKFSQIQGDEWGQCLRRELYREKIQAENGGSFPSEIRYVPTNMEHRRFILKMNGAKPGEGILEWIKRQGKKPAGTYCLPDSLSYLAQRKNERWKRLPKAEVMDRSLWLSMDWHTLYREWGDGVEYAGTHLPFPPIMDDNGETEIVPMKIPWWWRDDEITAAFIQWLKNNRPVGEAGDDRRAMPEQAARPNPQRWKGARDDHTPNRKRFFQIHCGNGI